MVLCFLEMNEMKYEKPCLADLNLAGRDVAQAACTGSGASVQGSCWAGNAANVMCYGGNKQLSETASCANGTNPMGGCGTGGGN